MMTVPSIRGGLELDSMILEAVAAGEDYRRVKQEEELDEVCWTTLQPYTESFYCLQFYECIG